MSKVMLGTVSEGTLRNIDLIPTFLETLFDLNKEAHERIRLEHPGIEACDDDWFDSEDADFMLESLIEALNDEAPAFCYFGASEGDLADFGFWPDWDALKESEYDGIVIHVDVFRKVLPEYVESVNDHGNVTLYSVTLTEVWATV